MPFFTIPKIAYNIHDTSCKLVFYLFLISSTLHKCVKETAFHFKAHFLYGKKWECLVCVCVREREGMKMYTVAAKGEGGGRIAQMSMH